jgi:hypothetical protein
MAETLAGDPKTPVKAARGGLDGRVGHADGRLGWSDSRNCDRRPDGSVLNGAQRLWGIPNLYAIDGSVFPRR